MVSIFLSIVFLKKLGHFFSDTLMLLSRLEKPPFYPNNAIKVPRAKKLRQNMIVPATKTPPMQARTLFLNPMSRILAARVPVHAPVPGRGIPTKRRSATNNPWPAFSCSFLPPFSPFSRQNEKNLPITGLGPLPRQEFFLQTNK